MPLPQIERLGPARLVVTDRTGGVSRAPWDSLNLADHVGDDDTAVVANRARVLEHLGVRDVAVVEAQHGNAVQQVSGPGTAPAGDILLTRRPGLALLVLAADCVPAVLVAPDAAAVAVVHAGWRGIAADAAGAAVSALLDLGADPAGLLARLGPAIGPDCYEVSPEVCDEVAAAAPPARAVTATGAPAVDLVAGFCWQLRRHGVTRVTTDARCTYRSQELYSYRRQRRTGRHGAMVVLGDG